VVTAHFKHDCLVRVGCISIDFVVFTTTSIRLLPVSAVTRRRCVVLELRGARAEHVQLLLRQGVAVVFCSPLT
jgi:hypothetical protein